MSNVNKANLLLERTSGVPLVIFHLQHSAIFVFLYSLHGLESTNMFRSSRAEQAMRGLLGTEGGQAADRSSHFQACPSKVSLARTFRKLGVLGFLALAC